jgi:hypothetical protein
LQLRKGFTIKGRDLYNWADVQRRCYKNTRKGLRPSLSQHRIDRLSAAGFRFDCIARRHHDAEERWSLMLDGLVAVKETKGT